MFGKRTGDTWGALELDTMLGFNPRVRGTCLVSGGGVGASGGPSSCAVSIPVCGEHVW
jgi:hypothetical protein